MKETVIVRAIDEFGRITIPMPIRKRLNLQIGTPVQIYIQNECVVLRKHSDSCVFCSNTDNITDFKGKHVCAECLELLKSE